MTASRTARATRLNPEQRREQLLKLGVGMLRHRTLDEISVEAVAERAGISRNLLFHYFSSKLEFHREVMRVACADHLAKTEKDQSLPPRERLRDGLVKFVDYALDNRVAYLSIVRGAGSVDAGVRDIVDGTRTVHTERLLSAVEELHLDRDSNLRLMFRCWVAFAEEAVAQWPADEDTLADRDRLVDFLTDNLQSLVRGVTLKA
jgi:AcrR family transcriptional regulator